MPHKIDDLREHLFATLEALRDPTKPMEVDRARAIAEVARVVVDTAKVEVEHLDLVGGRGSGFLPEPDQAGGDKPRPPVALVGHAISRGK